jgi:hypothetical protein
LESHVFRERRVRFGVRKVIRTVLDTVIDIEVATFATSIVSVKELGLYREQFGATEAFTGCV